MPFDLLSAPDESLASILEKAGAKHGLRIIRSNKAMLAAAKHIRTQFKLHSNKVSLFVGENGISELYEVDFSDFQYHFDEVVLEHDNIHAGEEFARRIADLYKISCQSLNIRGAFFTPGLVNALQDVTSKLKLEVIKFHLCSSLDTAEWKAPIPLIVYSDVISDMVHPFWFMRNCPETPYMVFDIDSFATFTSVAILSQIIEKWRDGGLVSGRKWLQIRLFRLDNNADDELTPELVKELFASLWTDFEPEDVTEQLRVETQIAKPPLVKLKIEKSPDSKQSLHVLFSDVEGTTPIFDMKKLQIDLIPNYDSGFDYAFPAEK